MDNPFSKQTSDSNPFSEVESPFKPDNSAVNNPFTPLKDSLIDTTGLKLEKGSLMYALSYVTPTNFLKSGKRAFTELLPGVVKIGGEYSKNAGEQLINTAGAYAKSIADPKNFPNYISEAFQKNSQLQNQMQQMTAAMGKELFLGTIDSGLQTGGFVKDNIESPGKWKYTPLGYTDTEGKMHPSFIWRDLIERPFEALNDALSIYSIAKFGLLKGAKYVTPGTPAPKVGPIESKATEIVDYFDQKYPGIANAKQHLEDWHNFQQVNLIKANAQDLFYRTQNKSMKFINEKFGNLTPEESSNLGLYVSGIKELPNPISKQLKTAITSWNKLDTKTQNLLIDKTQILTQQAIDIRSWKPLIAQKLGTPIEITPEKGWKYNANQLELDLPGAIKGNIEKGLTKITSGEFENIKNSIKKEMQFTDSLRYAKPGEYLNPKYFPFVQESDKIVRPGSLTPKKENFMKTATMQSLMQDTYEKNSVKALMIHQSQINRMIGNRKIAEGIVGMDTTLPFHGTAAEQQLIDAGTHVIWNPQGWLTQQHVASLMDNQLLKNMEQYGDVTYAMNKTIDELTPIIEQLGNSKPVPTYLVPKKVFDTLHYYVPQNPDPIFNISKSMGKSIYDVWRWSVLQGRPKWLVNNAIGNTVMAGLAGGTTNTAKYGTNLERLLPSNLDDTYFLTLQTMQPPSKYNFIGRYTNFMSKLNYELDNAMREGVYLKQAEIVAKKNLILNTGKKTFTSNEITKELIRITKEEPGQVHELIKYVNDFLPDFQHMSTFEKTVVRKIIPFWAFIKHQALLDTKLVFKYPERTLYMRGLNRAAEAITDPKDLQDLREGKVFGIDLRGPNPLLPGGSLLIVTPLIKAPVEWLAQVNLSTGTKFTAPYALQLSGGGYLIATTRGPKIVSKIVGPMEEMGKQVPYINATMKYLQDHADITGKKVLSKWKIKDLPETLLNLFVIGTYHQNEQMEKLQEIQNYQRDVNSLIKQMGEKQFREAVQKSPQKIQGILDMIRQNNKMDEPVLTPDNSNPFDDKTKSLLHQLDSTLFSEIHQEFKNPFKESYRAHGLEGSPASPSTLPKNHRFAKGEQAIPNFNKPGGETVV